MSENERSVITPTTTRQPRASRRSLLALTPLAAVAAAAPGVTLGQMHADRELIAKCGEVIELERHIWSTLPGRFAPGDDFALEAAQAPFADRSVEIMTRIIATKSHTPAGITAKAHALAAFVASSVEDDEGDALDRRAYASILRDLLTVNVA
ncbi:hypothetical protein [Acidocella facilis]|uniref:hypothetical protein n=1 Tax=Acidocella facilis TaxID=525 RepID=UPI001F18C276|nr:hypothetical protein [Acidocella facilis]